MVAADDGAAGDDKMEDSCNGNETTTAATLVSQMSAGEPMQVDGDGNFILPQVDGPIDALLSEDEEKMDLDEEPAPSESATESANVDETTTVAEQDVNIQTENVQTEESTIKEEVATPEATTTESITPAATGEISEEAADNPLPDNEIPIETSANDTEQSNEKEVDIKPLIDETKPMKSDLPLVESSVETPSEQTTLTDVVNSTATKTDETQQDENNQEKDIKLEPYSAEDEKSLTTENLFAEDTDTSHHPKDETQEAEKVKDENVEPEINLSAENSLAKSEDASEPMATDDSTLTATDAVNVTPVTTQVVTPSVQIKLQPTDEPTEHDKSPDVPVSSINGVALPLEKELEDAKVHTPVKMEVKDEVASSKKENLKQEKLNDARSETGDDSTALTTLATAALGSAESPIKVKNEQVDFIIMYCFCNKYMVLIDTFVERGGEERGRMVRCGSNKRNQLYSPTLLSSWR